MSVTIEVVNMGTSVDDWLNNYAQKDFMPILNTYGQRGVDVLKAATPKATGLTANSWTYEIDQNGSNYTIGWVNTNKPNGFGVAAMLDMGHGTGTGGFVPGKYYVDPAIEGIFQQFIADLCEEVKR